MRHQIKSIISNYQCQKGIFLSIINERGHILNVNAKMRRELHLQERGECNFFDLIGPSHISEFQHALMLSADQEEITSAEIYLKNGHYHPMKWQIKCLKKNEDDKAYLCIGHKILDDERIGQFNKLGERYYQLIFGGLNAGVLFQDTKGELIAANHKAAEIFNTTLERLYQLNDIGSLWNTIWDVRTENGEKVFFDDTPFIRSLRTGQPQTEVLIVRLNNGEKRWLHFSSQPIFDDERKQPISVVSNLADLTHERRLISELKERKALFQSFMRWTPNMAWVVDEDATLVFANHAFFRFFRLDESESLNKKISDIIPGPVVKALYDKHIESLITGKTVELVEKIKWADGTDLVFLINLFAIEGIAGKKKIGGHAVNLTDKYSIEKRLKETNDRLLLLTRTTTDAIWEWDMQSGHIFRNDALMDMIGYNSNDSKGLSWWLRRIHPEDRNMVSDKVKESTENNKQSWEGEYRFKCADGNYKHMRDKGYIVYENGLPVKMIGSLQDITNLKNLESLLTEEKLERQKEISETVIRVQEMERTRIGHELHDNVNQILSSARLFLEMLSPGDKKQKEVKQRSLDLITNAIEEIRLLSKEMVIPQLKEKGIEESIQSFIDDIHASTKIAIKFSSNLVNKPLSSGIQVTLFRIVQEQLKNVLRHSKAKRVTLTLENDETNVTLRIQDDGIGFDPKQTRRGIGLSNIFERTRFYNGEAELHTAPGKGCSLNISIPLIS